MKDIDLIQKYKTGTTKNDYYIYNTVKFYRKGTHFKK